ncbi:MAG: undecaprenyldiphospho-muramoylpentapeptide beta-N-acetylglucosaminyltransferase [Bacteroidetes bacterium]|nr:undecaprenyldiphospho-muramoylpentapeptide beta-N-acetylglucosaminyltransferase [Bacteroidota bacterium]
MSKRIIIAGGGTGGHIFPAIAIANALVAQDPTVEILFVGANGKMEMEKVPEAGYRIEGITIAGFNRSSLLKNISLPFKLITSYFQVKKIFKEFLPDAVVGVGGYSTLPVLRLAQAQGIPTFVHESNSFAGKANIYLGKKATKIFVASEGMQKFFPEAKLMVTGNPVRKQILESTITKAEAIQYFGLKESVTTVLVMGGSLGAKSINDAILNHMEQFERRHLQLIWQTGKTNAEKYKAATEGKPHIWIGEFITDMDMAYAAADIIVSRAGAMAVTEISIQAKPAVFVPFPLATEDHQTHNAMRLVNQDAALIVRDGDAKLQLVSTSIQLAKDQAMQALFTKNCKSLSLKDADTVIAKEILKAI